MGWEYRNLGDLCEVIAGQSPEGKFYNDNGEGLPFYQGKKDFGDKYIDAPRTWTKKVTKQAKDGDILMSVRAPVGPINFSVEDICIGRGLAAIRSSAALDKDFLFYVLLSKQDEIKGHEGAVFASINKKQIEQLSIPNVTLAEQQRIVAILDQAFADIEKARASAEKNLKNARELFDNYLWGIFGRPDESWIETTVGDLCVKMEYGSSAKSQNEGEIPVLRMGNLQKGQIDWTDLKYSADPEEIKKYMLQKGDVLFNRTNSDEHVGKTAIYRGEMPAIFAGYLIRVHRKQELLDGEFLNFYLNSSIARDYGKTVMSRSVNQANINASKLKEYPIAVPDMKTQKQLVSIFSSLKDELERLEKVYVRKVTLLETLKKSLLQKAFSGELTKSKGIAA